MAMVNLGAAVNDEESLAEFERALRHYAHRNGENVRAIEVLVDRQAETLSCALSDAKKELARSTVSLRYADEDEVSYWEDEVAARLERVDRLRGWLRRVEPQLREFRSASANFKNILRETIPGALSFLAFRIDRLQEYRAVRVNEAPRAVSAVERPITGGQCLGEVTIPSGLVTYTALSDCHLPDGFAWVPLSQIDLETLDGSLPYSKISYEAMKQGLLGLRDHILPAMQNCVRPMGEYFDAVDAEGGRCYENGLRRIYDAFFGQQDYIYLVRGRSTPLFDIINGRHRIRIARDLGWDSIPAQIKDLTRDETKAH